MQKIWDFVLKIAEEQGIELVIVACLVAIVAVVIFLRVVLKLVRSVIPSFAERRAIRIANETVSDVVPVVLNYSIRENKTELIEASINKLNCKKQENDTKIGELKRGLSKLGYFSKAKKDKIEKRLTAIEQANKTITYQINSLTKVKDQMKWFLEVKQAKQGDVITFGKTGWLVMQRNGNSLLLLSLRVLDVTFNRGGWAKGNMRSACHSLYTQFEPAERELIQATKNRTANENYVTTDYLFALSPEEFASMPNVTWKTLDYRQKGNSIELFDVVVNWKTAEWEEKATDSLNDFIYDYHEGYGGRLERSFNGTPYDRGWWLRSAENERIYVDGKGRYHRNDINIDVCGIRPAMYITV